MGLFKGKNIKEVKRNEVPSLPELPELPEYSGLEIRRIQPVTKLPKSPSSFYEERFSQNTINETVSGEEDDEEAWKADEFAREQEMQTMQEPLKKPLIKHYEENFEEIPEEFRYVAKEMKKIEPLFIRIDKFEESLKMFEKIKEKVSEIDKLLKNVKEVKEKEEGELNLWENKIQIIKKQIERIDKNIFSKV